ncbi:MAG: ATP-dependent sacrificial sulfur transferase LarE [Candidatus Margulisiibacteriota bacterium]|nr:MAG: TIGR00268 family protein [Candidatus Margulisbacteria bacterium GWD2_39_127]OGI05566.1 MAG: TIGR00268 family protein [Candidatus Margulisbacteria bacterium GWF2_38_17]OGI09494.1 MAG: TIGR00268 family protein [Candidatus Margulisbacteria bacterium GWE2_39_32]PZM77030.1 MAG: ATP-dependent sacrificial sulfur transferase LarE [Candidatus Margulisiibacteriota bacterium]HAR62097.1 ATP-dependent sacrificial sulfur transferase LarE [Candidatus Margulisiibacteriota bacterium]
MQQENLEIRNKYSKLQKEINKYGSAIVAFSGGVDSTFLTKVTFDVLGENMLAVTAKSETYSDSELACTKEFSGKYGIPHIIIETSELGIEHFAENPANRCYYCKQELYSKLTNIKNDLSFSYVFDGSNADDIHDYRPGMQAVDELGIKKPLLDSGLTKNDIRALSKELGLETHDKPAMACLSSRFPYGTKITLNNIRMVGAAETFIKNLGVSQLRVRYHGDVARIETDENYFFLLLENREIIVKALKDIGFKYITVDIEGYRTGSLNEPLFVVDRK